MKENKLLSLNRKELIRVINKHTKADGTLDDDIVEILKDELFSHEQSHLTNSEKYVNDIIEMVRFAVFGVDSHEGKIKRCCDLSCFDCLFYSGEGENCTERRKCWIDKRINYYTISERDRMFLDYVDSKYKYMSKSTKGNVYFLKDVDDDYADVLIRCINIDFPMIEPGCKKPWKIEDLKQLQTVDNY